MCLRPMSVVCNITILSVAICGLSIPLRAQETTTTTNKQTSITRAVKVENAQVVYVSGDDVVLKDSNGRLRLLGLPAGTPLVVDGKPAKLSDLTPGTTLSHVQARTVVQSDVTTVTQIDGVVTRVVAPKWVTLRLGDGTVKQYEIPKHTKFQINGADATAFDLKKGMKISATAVTTQGMDSHSGNAAMLGQTPPQVGVLLIVPRR